MKQFRGANVRISAPQNQTLPLNNMTGFNLGPQQGFMPIETAATILTRTNLLTQEQIAGLTELTIGGEPLLSAADRNAIYEVIGLIAKLGYDATYEYLSSSVANVQVGDLMTINRVRKNLVWMSPTMEKPRHKYEVDVEIKRNKTEVVAGASRCGRCGSEEVMTAQRQTRSADEPMTNFNLCVSCGNRWKS
jgi:DNA-directed RNA polymerase subunit M/transcription elongation factor TFIIS